MGNQSVLPPNEKEQLLAILKARFEKNMTRHPAIKWEDVLAKLDPQPAKLWSLHEMERTGGEPDVVRFDEQKDAYLFFDCSAESPSGRRSLCYDPLALESRKENKPKHSAIGMAKDLGIDLMTEDQYRHLQQLGKVDTKTSSWIITPPDIRKLGGAIFGDYRYGQVFIYHNGAESYYAARGFRGVLYI
jgi:hypothetical protein